MSLFLYYRRESVSARLEHIEHPDVQILDVTAEVGDLSVLADRYSERAVTLDRLDHAV